MVGQAPNANCINNAAISNGTMAAAAVTVARKTRSPPTDREVVRGASGVGSVKALLARPNRGAVD